MSARLDKSPVRIFDPNSLALRERTRLFAALDQFLKMGDSLDQYLAFGRQNPHFFPVRLMDRSQVSLEAPPAGPCVQGWWEGPDGVRRPQWTRLVTWEPACHKLVLFHRDRLRDAWHPPLPGPWDISTGEQFEILLGCQTDRYADLEYALAPVFEAYPGIELEFMRNPIRADWKSGTFVFEADNDFRRAVYVLFREGWRARTCNYCSRPFIADKPAQSYCSPECLGEARRQEKLTWWHKEGKHRRLRRRRRRKKFSRAKARSRKSQSGASAKRSRARGALET